ncbi:hypothetical protein PHYPSEUDO_007274 [Phytophthora pseudosyringae]|uniref:Uncharacterized protein n=1 Tax=Phytophthora pseudosyringae TaxID=221518 RepID=A0A8T1VGB1_9STRA|nr:hypothetical protein PHYPSEUDO_007274 [Phytophthora pseudosyringae]
MAQAVRPSALKPARTTDGDAPEEATGEEDPSSFPLLNPTSPAAQTPRHAGTREPPQLERAVVSRTRLHITLATPPPPSGAGKTSSSGEADLRGWSSPHGEPYRPLGRPELNLKFLPHFDYGVSSPVQNAHRLRALEGVGGSNSGATGAASSSASERAKEVREASTCAPPTSARAPIATLVDQFVTSLTSRKRPLDGRQVKLAHRLQANVGGFSPEIIRGLRDRKLVAQEQDQEFAGGGPQHCFHTPRGDTSLQLLREALQEGTSRLRSTRNGTNFLQHLPPSEFHGLRELHEQYLRGRMASPPTSINCGSRNVGATTSPRMILVSKTTYGEFTSKPTAPFSRDEDAALDCSDSDDSQGNWYLPYTTRQLQRSPHRRLPSLGEFRARAREEKQPTRPLRATSNMKASLLPHRMRASAARSNHASLASARPSVAARGTSDDDILEPNAAVLSTAIGKVPPSPFAMTAGFPSPSQSVPQLHSIEKLQAAVDALEDIKCRQSARLATALEVLEQDRRECLAGKFCSLRVKCDAAEDLKRMRERSERHRGQRVIAVVSKTADWYPELLHRLIAREGTNTSNTGPGSIIAGGLLPLHAAELFIVQAVRRFTTDGCEFQSAQLYSCIAHLHREDLELLQVQQLLEFLRNALHINDEEWKHFFAAHGLPEPTDDFVGDRKDSQGFSDGKPCVSAATRHE